MHQLGAAAGSAFAEVALLEQEHVVSAGGAVDGHTYTGSASANDDHVPRPRVRAEALIHLGSVHGFRVSRTGLAGESACPTNVGQTLPSVNPAIGLSENQLQRELYLPRWIGVSNGSESRTGGLCVRYAEVRVVENVEEIRPELQLGFFEDPVVL